MTSFLSKIEAKTASAVIEWTTTTANEDEPDSRKAERKAQELGAKKLGGPVTVVKLSCFPDGQTASGKYKWDYQAQVKRK